jgi:hypothetical protein
MPVLYGVFMYMGIDALNGIQLVQRVGLFLMPIKHQPTYHYLRHVPLLRVHLFTAAQVGAHVHKLIIYCCSSAGYS